MPRTAEPTFTLPPSRPRKRQETKLVLVDRNGDRVLDANPEITPWRIEGWSVRRVEPRVVEHDGAQWLVVLTRDLEPPALPNRSVSLPRRRNTSGQ